MADLLFDWFAFGLTSKTVSSGCGSVGRAVTSNCRGLWFESSHWQKNYIEHLLSTVLKRRK